MYPIHPNSPSPLGLPSGSFTRRRGPRRAQSFSFGRLGAAPHRVAFFAGAVVLAAAALWWTAALLARHAGLALPWDVRPGTAHALVMGLGFMPFFFVGFLFTAGPRWLQQPAQRAADLALPLGLMAAGWLLALPGFHLAAALAALGLATAAVGLALATGRFLLLVLQSRVAEREHAVLAAGGCAVTAMALWAAAAGVALGQDAAARAALHFALWGGLAPVFVAVTHRMLPFFSAAALPAQDAWRPRVLLWLMVGAVAVQAPLAALQAFDDGPSSVLLSGLRAALELPAGALMLWLALRWGLLQSLKIRLLAMLHMGFFWLGVAFTLGGVSHALMSASDGTLSLGLAPLHALTMGFLGSTLVAMATRVACGHSGRSLVADNWAWAVFWALQAGVLLRVTAALVPPALSTPLTLLAAQFWLAAVGAWALRHGRWFGLPRADGQAG
ncbi:uncharacterized protein involved in response to NO [Burkholderiales bacterium JOSHI_001]|nr:uncharacterized protein involved in response to NO [Burkholderiales bacterium JOSHI_001]